MDSNKTTLERAFELARSGECESVSDIRAKLSVEGYSLAQLTGGSLQKQLRELIKTNAKSESASA